MTTLPPPAQHATIGADESHEPVHMDDPRLRAWRAFLYAHAAVMRELEAQLVAERGMTLAEYDALVQLAGAPGARLRMSDLAERVLLSRSGLTRLVDRLVAQGNVRREHCGSDARGSFAALTVEGVRRLREAMPVHLRGIGQLFVGVVDEAETAAVERAMTAVAAAAGHPVPGLERPPRGGQVSPRTSLEPPVGGPGSSPPEAPPAAPADAPTDD